MPAKPISFCRQFIVLAAMLCFSQPAFAHPGHDEVNSFAAGFAHPFGGIDHLSAMILVGIMAVIIGVRAIWVVPLSFMTVMFAGFIIGANAAVPSVIEFGIWGSVVTLATLLILRVRLPIWVAATLAGFFALFHGFAHAAEMSSAPNAYIFGAGFMTATAALHLFGVMTGALLQRWLKKQPAAAVA